MSQKSLGDVSQDAGKIAYILIFSEEKQILVPIRAIVNGKGLRCSSFGEIREIFHLAEITVFSE